MKNTRPSNWLKLLSLLLLTLFLFSCAGTVPVDECVTGKQYGFIYGLLHGFITPFSIIVSFFDDDVTIYAVNNTGWWYNLGFLLGSGGWGFMAGNRSKKG